MILKYFLPQKNLNKKHVFVFVLCHTKEMFFKWKKLLKKKSIFIDFWHLENNYKKQNSKNLKYKAKLP